MSGSTPSSHASLAGAAHQNNHTNSPHEVHYHALGECGGYFVAPSSPAQDGRQEVIENDRYSGVSNETAEAMATPLTVPHTPTAPANNHSPQSQRQRAPVRLDGRDADTPKVLSATIIRELRELLPVRQRLAKSWRLVYSMDQHGISMNSLLSRCENAGPMMLAIKDTKGR
ncbi:oxidation resistance protein 1, partial [Linderina pennispora]